MNIYMRNWKEKLKKALYADREVIMTELYGPLYSSTISYIEQVFDAKNLTPTEPYASVFSGTVELAKQVFGTEVYILTSSLFRCKSIKLDTHEDEKAFRFICENTQPPGFLATDSCEIDRASFCEKQTWFKSNGIKTGLSDRTFLLDEWQKAGGVLYVDSEIDIDINAFREFALQLIISN